MSKIYKMNAGGTLGVSLNKRMKEVGYKAEMGIEWKEENGRFYLEMKKPQDIPPVEKDEVKEAVQPL